MSHQVAKRIVSDHLRAEGVDLVAGPAIWDRFYGVWIVAERDPAQPDEMLFGGAHVVTADGSVHGVGSAPGSLEMLMEHLGIRPSLDQSAWEREGEGLALLADEDMEEAEGLAAYAHEQQRRRQDQTAARDD